MQTGSSLNSGVNRAANAASKSVSEAVSAASDKADNLGETFSRVKDQLISAVSDEAEMASDFTKHAVKQIPALMNSVESTIRKHPFTAAAVALGIGALAVNLITRERRVRMH